MGRKILLSCVVALLCLSQVFSQTIPAERTTDWTLAGFKGSRQVDYTVINFVDEGGIGDGFTVNDAVYQAILDGLDGDPAVIYFPPGNYFFNSTIHLRSNLVIRGAGADLTTLQFDLSGEGDLVYAGGSVTGTSSDLTASAAEGGYDIEVVDASIFNPGDYVKFIEDDDSLITSDWALYTSGQIAVIESIDANSITFKSPVRRRYLLGNQPRIVKLLPDRNIGIEGFTIFRVDATPGQTSNIKLEITADSWVDCVSSFNSNFCHIDLRTCTNVDVTGCYMQDAFAYGGGGQGYGVVVHSTSGECLVTDNRFKHLRHSILIQSGANGNVIAYNYSTDPFWTELGPSNYAGDLVLHGNWPYLNLLEGNEVANIAIDASHGRNGAYNTLFRNRATLYGLIMSTIQATPMQNLVGNEITNPNLLMGLYIVAGYGHFQHGNNVRGQITPGGTGNLPEASLYLDQAPRYYIDNNSWPPIGVPNTINSNINQAKDIYLDGFETTCESDIITGIFDASQIPAVKVYPNPSGESIYLDIPAESMELYNPLGKLVKVKSNSQRMDVCDLAPGSYLLKVILYDKSEITRRVVVAGN